MPFGFGNLEVTGGCGGKRSKSLGGQVDEKMEGDTLEIVSIQTFSKVICHKGGREVET